MGGDEQRQRGRGRIRRGDLRPGHPRRLVYFWQQADSLVEYVFALFQGLFWPAWMVYELFDTLAA